MCDEGSSFRSTDAARIARDHFWHGIGQPGENHERMEIVHPPPRNVVVQTTLRREGCEEQTLGSVTKLAQGQWLVLLSASAEETCVRDGVARGRTPWISKFSGLRHCSAKVRSLQPAMRQKVRQCSRDRGDVQRTHGCKRQAAGATRPNPGEHFAD